jgi:membrane protein implicated in regulation of membrane protease activity
MTARYFIVMMILSRAFSVFSTAYSVALIPLNTWWGLAIWAAILILLVILFVFAYKNMDKIRVYAAKNKKGQ